jgi:hypothetical protein
MRLEGLGQLKNRLTLSRIEPASFRLVAGMEQWWNAENSETPKK